MDIMKVIGVGLIGVMTTIFLRNVKSDYGTLVILATGLLLLIIIINSLKDVVLSFNEIIDKSGVDKRLMHGVLKMVGIGYVVEYSASMCADFNAKSVGDKIELAGKIAIFLMAMPIVMSLLDTVTRLVNI